MGGYNLYGDDEELKRLLAAGVPSYDQGSPATPPRPQDAAAPPVPPQGAIPVPQPQGLDLNQLLAASAASNQEDQGFKDALREKQMEALRNTHFDQQKYGLGEFARDNGAAALAAILDIGFNKGRGLGGIVNATAGQIRANDAEREARSKEAADFALRARGTGKPVDPVAQALAIGRLGVSDRNAVTGEKKVKSTEDQRKAVADINSPYWETKIGGAEKVARSSTTGRLNAEHALNEQETGDKANIAGGQEAARVGARLDLAPQTAAAAAQAAAEKETATVAAGREAQASGRPLPIGFTLNDADPYAAQRYKNIVADPQARGKMEADTMASRELQDAANKLSELRAKNGPQFLPSTGSGEYNALHTAVIGAANRIIANAGTLNAGERALLESVVPGSKPDWKDLAGWVAGQDFNAQQLEGFAKGLQQIINSRVTGYGIKYGGDQPPPPVPQPQPQLTPEPAQQPGLPAPQLPAEVPGPVPGTLGTTSNRLPSPAQVTGAGNAQQGGMVRLRFTDPKTGKTETSAPMPYEKADRVMKRNRDQRLQIVE